MLTSVNIKRILSLLMCLVLLAAVGLSARAETRTNPLGIPDDQYENIVEFLDTINPETRRTQRSAVLSRLRYGGI